MALEDLAMIRAVHGSTVLYPPTPPAPPPWCTAWRTPPASAISGPPAAPTPSCTTPQSSSPSAVPSSCGPPATTTSPSIGAGVTLHEALKAADILDADGIQARVIDCYSIKPIDAETLLTAAGETQGRVVIAEDHHPEGGLGSAVKDALLMSPPSDLSIAHLAVRGMPGSGTGQELLAWAGIDAEHIAGAARDLIRPNPHRS